jgi:hypothetical protein
MGLRAFGMYFPSDFEIIIGDHCIRDVLANVVNANQQENPGGLQSIKRNVIPIRF